MSGGCPRRFGDDGTDVTVDLHGCTVEDAVYIIRRCVQEASRRGRARVVVIHGRSSEMRGGGSSRTIKGELERMLDSGELATWVSGSIGDAAGGQTTLWMSIGQAPNSSRIRMQDVVPR